MNKIFLGSCVLIISAMVTGCSTPAKVTTSEQAVTVAAPPADTLINAADTFAYGLGMNIANNLKEQGVDQISYDALKQGMKDVFNGTKTAITEQDANTSIQKTLQELAAMKIASEKAKAVAFLDSNAKRPGVITLPNGLQYEVMKTGDSTSAMPKAEDTIVAHYVGMLIDGKEFDNSVSRGQPLTIKANEVIKGWTEIVQLMHIGDKWTVFIPSELGYGDRGAGADIPPGATLVFEMELLGVKPFVAKTVQAPVADKAVIQTAPAKIKTKVKAATKTKAAGN